MKMRLAFTLWIIMLFAGMNSIHAQVIKGTYAIKNVQTGILLRPLDANKKDGVPIIAYSPVNWKCVTWDFNHLEGDTYQLRNLFTGKTFQPVLQHPAEGDSLIQQPLVTNQSNQQFEFIPVKKNTYLIRLKGTSLYVMPSDQSGSINAPILLKKRNNKDDQFWTIYEQHPTM
ncbi:RICIN domain-containing protein [Chitinophagaceae bacterium LB-8]|uniref:RICIN domain-containing protein n=1 Tax=Paraflavisolibacter caeni TaxID=2982496 RepID=A0A9X3BFT4_9BACT|nr:RICIN domain-containing protein [Paraflavisolibacter caeni]MCU7549594.1 RICIN domain-containing protein [Paraflavisolibacter caeni]